MTYVAFLPLWALGLCKPGSAVGPWAGAPTSAPHAPHSACPVLASLGAASSPPFSGPPACVTTPGLVIFENFCCVVFPCLFVSYSVKRLLIQIFTVDKQIQKINRCVLQMYFTKITSLVTRRSILRG